MLNSAAADARVEDKTGKYPPLSCVYFYLAGACNLRCRHCWVNPRHETRNGVDSTLDFQLFQSAIDQAKPLGLSSVKLTGGEPLLHPRIHEILRFIKDEDISLTVETNGTLCTSKIAEEIAACKQPFVSVSVDGADAATHEWVRNVPGCFDDAVVGVRNLVQLGLKPQVIMTIMRRNKHQMQEIVRLAESLGAGSVKFNLMQPTARGKKMYDTGEALDIEEYVQLGQWVQEGLSLSTNLKLIYSHPPAFRPLSDLYGADGTGSGLCAIMNIIGVLSDGSYALCGIGETVQELVFGHISQEPLADVWSDNPVLLSIREGLPGRLEGICSECAMKNMCLGCCIAHNYSQSKSLWVGNWYCEMAHSKGLFPATRYLPSGQSPESEHQ